MDVAARHESIDRQLEAAQDELVARHAPGTRVRRVRWSQGETQVLELGAGSPLLLVHGGLDNAFEWLPLFPELARDRRVLAVDLPGHGLADPFDYANVNLPELARTFLGDVLDALGLRRADIAANSVGGFFASVFALDAPERVHRLALVGAPGGVHRRVPFPLRLFGLRLVGRPLARLLLSAPTVDDQRKIRSKLAVAHPEKLDPAILRAEALSMRRNEQTNLGLLRCLLDGWSCREHFLLGDRLEALNVPTLVLWGERDAFGAADPVEAMAAHNQNLRVVRIADAGHLCWVDDPARVLSELRAFFAAEMDA